MVHEELRKVTIKWIGETALGTVTSVVASLIATLIAGLGLTGSTPGKDLSSGIWIPIGLGLAVAVLLVVFVLILRREPSKVFQLRQKLVSVYLDSLSESFRGSNITGKT